MPGKYETILKDCYTGKIVTLRYNNHTFNGLIIEETKNTFIIEVKSYTGDTKQVKIIPKKDSLLILDDEKNTLNKITVDGKLLVHRPDKRIKLRVKRKW